ncbi:hypothetical protein DV737_g3904, partial [Chaetothyriales sp. CBS 132003]
MIAIPSYFATTAALCFLATKQKPLDPFGSIVGPLITANFPDPAIIHDNGVSYAFATNNRAFGGTMRHVQIATSTDNLTWTVLPDDALPIVGAWQTGARVWAPDVVRVADGTFVLYYTDEPSWSPAHHCLGVATSNKVAGPYVPSDQPFACPGVVSLGGAIDPDGFLDTSTNKRYVVYKVDGNSVGHGGSCNNDVPPIVPTPIMLQEVADDGVTKIGEPVRILDRGDQDGPLVEAPTLYRSDEGIYFLFFSSNCFTTPLYDVAYATALNITGPYTRAGRPLLISGDGPNLVGPGGLDIIENGNVVVFHGHMTVENSPELAREARRQSAKLGKPIKDIRMPFVRGMYSAEATFSGRQSANPRTVGLDIQRRAISTRDIPSRDRARLRRRSSTVGLTLDNEQTLYYANVTLGTPEQSLRLHLDTGSSDLWVNSPSSSLCESSSSECEGGTYNSSASSTYQLVNSDFNISYVDGSGAAGDYVSDTLRFGSVKLTDFQFGVGSSSSSAQGVLGIGYVINEVQVNRAGLDSYPNLPAALVEAGLIQSNAYSLWLNDLDASTGTILFGGVNSAKYTGGLATVPVIKTYGSYYTLSVALTGFSISGENVSSSSLPAAVLLDSGSTLTYLPDDITSTIYDQVSAVYDSSAGVAYAKCSLQDSDASLDFEFSGQTISVPYNELLIEVSEVNGQQLTFKNGETACLFGIAPADDSTSVLGDTFLRSAYVVYDLDNNEISLAQTVFNATGDDVLEITTGTSAVPGATAVASAVTSVVSGATGGATLVGVATSTPSSALSNSTSAAPTNSAPSAIVALVAAVAALTIL